ncbi:TM2 domain-containing protein [Sphingobacteriales bacterium UPWRP_1]|nr:hypothetical protein BVG80_17450 [Sphingobacteriales bacterium TSM_CSM]PSJ71893.1 TM2 domain-containing protein [Sphingobacteriales bacterium UPWRP_1]
MNNSQELNAAQVDFNVTGNDLGLNPNMTKVAGLNPNMTKVAGDKNPVVAFILAWFLGSLGIHRFYLGTKTLTGIGYILTCGGFGIVALVDWVMLLIGLIDDDISKYIDNPKFFMWLD